MNRRTFLLGSSASLVSTGFGKPVAQRLEAAATVFYAQPDGRAVLVRFTAHGVTAPAARLRVFGPGRRLLGTAGMLPAGDTLYGELWLPLERETSVTSELEAPGLRGAHRTNHRLRPAPRWTIHWLRIRDPNAVAEQVELLPPMRRAVQAALLRATGTLGNAVRHDHTTTPVDHADFLGQGVAAQRIAEQTGIELSPVAAISGLSSVWPTLPMVLAGSGIGAAIVRVDSGEPYRWWWQAPDGSRVLVVAVGADASSDRLEFGASVAAMAGRIEHWLAPLTPRSAVAAVLDTAEDEHAVTKLRNVEEWNRRYAFPHLVIGDGRSLVERYQVTPATNVVVTGGRTGSRPPASGTAIRAEARRLEEANRRRVDRLIAVAGKALGAPEGANSDAVLAALAANVNTEFPGVLVFNPTPVRRSDVAIMPDGTPFVVTDVPALGYAYVPDAVWRNQTLGTPGSRLGSGSPVRTPGAAIRLELDRRSGAIASLRTATAEWVAEGTDGLNALTGCILEGLEQETIPGVGRRDVMQRWSPTHGVVRSTITTYDALPFVDVENDAEGSNGEPMEYYYHWRLIDPSIAWEIPGGYEERPGIVWHIHAVRWMRVGSLEGTAFLASRDTHHGMFLPPATLVSTAPPGHCRLRLGVSETGGRIEDACAFGYGTESLRTVRVAGGGSRLPRFASLFRIEPDAVVAVSVKPVSGEDAAVLYLLNVTHQSRFASVSHGALRFTVARLVDFLGRDRGAVTGQLEDGVLVNVPARGAVAVRVDGVGLNG